MPVSKLDTIYRRILLTKFFTKGWGNPKHLLRLFEFRKIVSNRETCFQLVSKDHPITILNEQTWSDCKVIEGKFRSPLAVHLPSIVPHAVQDAFFQMIVPLKWKSSKFKPVCIHLAGTGDHYFWRRRNVMAKPLLKSDIGAIILENPFYGLRKPRDQIRSSLHNVSDIFIMGGCLILECIVLLHWCKKQGYGPLGLSGLSMGGHMASLAATNWPEPVVLVPCLSWSTASSVFTEGVMSESINWDLLQEQFISNQMYYDTLARMAKIVDKFTFNFATDLTNIDPDIQFQKSGFSTGNLDNFLNEIFDNIRKKTSAGTSQYNNRSQRVGKKLLSTSMKMSDLKKLEDQEAVYFMRGVMDECTHLKNFSVPVDTSLIIAVCAKDDGYVPRDGCSPLEDIWPGADVRYIPAGHVSAYIFYRKMFRNCIVEAFERAKKLFNKKDD